MKAAAWYWLALVALGTVAMLAERAHRAEARAERAEEWAAAVEAEAAMWVAEAGLGTDLENGPEE